MYQALLYALYKIHLILPILLNKYNYYPNFIDEKTKAQRSYTACVIGQTATWWQRHNLAQVRVLNHSCAAFSYLLYEKHLIWNDF